VQPFAVRRDNRLPSSPSQRFKPAPFASIGSNAGPCPEADLGKVDRPDLRRIGETASLARVASEEAAQEGSVRPR
jgi:hypothetical protein